MTINILHLYYDLMNLYGESGNVKAVMKSLKNQKIKVVLDELSIKDDINFWKYDFIYIGSGTEQNQLLALNHILKYKEDIKKYIEEGKFFLSTGNSYELFGEKINNIKALDMFKYSSISLDERRVGDIVARCNFLKDKIIGFQNQGSIIIKNNNPMFEDINTDYKEGVHYKNFFGTYFIGPILIRNPHLHKYIITNLLKNKNLKTKPLDLKLDLKAYKTYMDKYHKE